MELNLTAEQLEKAAEAGNLAFSRGATWKNIAWDMVPHLQAQPQQVSGSLVERMLKAYWGEDFTALGMTKSQQRMTAALAVAADELLADVKASTAEYTYLDQQCFEKGVQVAVNDFLASRRRARLFAPVDPAVEAVKSLLPAVEYRADAMQWRIAETDIPSIVAAVRRADATLKEKEQTRIIHGEPVHLPANAVMGAEMLREAEQG